MKMKVKSVQDEAFDSSRMWINLVIMGCLYISGKNTNGTIDAYIIYIIFGFGILALGVTWFKAIASFNQVKMDAHTKWIYILRGIDTQLFYIMGNIIMLLRISNPYFLVGTVIIGCTARWFDLFKLNHYFHDNKAECIFLYHGNRWIAWWINFGLSVVAIILIQVFVIK